MEGEAKMMKAILLVGLGGGVGSILRYLTSVVVAKYLQSVFPLATFLVNVLGCLIIGVLIGLFDRHQLVNPYLRFLFITGFCGGFTTFSAFAAENINLFNSGYSLTAFLYIGTSIFVSLFAVWLGMLLARM